LIKNLSLKTKFITSNILVGFFPFVLIAVISFLFLSWVSENERNVSIYYNVQNVADTLDNTITNCNELSKFIVGNEYVRAFLIPQHEINSTLYHETYKSAKQALGGLPFGTTSIKGVGIFSPDRQRYIISGSLTQLSLTDEELQRAFELKGGWFWSVSNNQMAICRLLRDKINVTSSLGIIKIVIDQDYIGRFFISENEWINPSFVILNATDQSILYGNTENEYVRKFLEAKNSMDSLIENDRITSFYEKEKPGVYITPWLLSDQKTILVGITPAVGYQYSLILKRLMIGAIIIAIMLAIVQLMLFRRLILKPLNKLGTLMKSIESENFSAHFKVRGNDEISVLGNQFNMMSDKLRFLYNEVYYSKLQMKNAEIKALQAEINPHFLFNTLNTIYWTIKTNESEAAGKMVRDLAAIFRLSLYHSSNGLVPLEVELEHIFYYLRLQKARMSERLIYSIEVEIAPELRKRLQVMKLILQPLVENAIVHHEAVNTPIEIQVTIYEAEKNLYYMVHDNGTNADFDKINRILHDSSFVSRGSHGLALHNTNERIKLKFGEDYGITCTSPVDGGTAFVVKMPLQYSDKGRDNDYV
jgi:two-component system sensor histidine kinase YesM